MQDILLGLTLGNDPHTVGIHRAGKIAKLAGIDYQIVPPATPDEEKIRILKKEDPRFIGLSYRLSAENALMELRKFLTRMGNVGLLSDRERKVAFAALPSTILAVQGSEIKDLFNLVLMDSHKSIRDNVLSVLDFLEIHSDEQRNQILQGVLLESEPAKIPELDQIANRVIDTYVDNPEKPLAKPSEAAIKFLPQRMAESYIPLIRSHIGIPSETIYPTVEAIENIALQGVVDEVSLGSSDLSQRYFGDPQAFKTKKNDGGVPYQTRDDLHKLFLATRRGNYPSIKPYAHVNKILEFIDDCLDAGMLIGAHQAIPLFWFSELDGRGPLSVQDALKEHIEAVNYLAIKNIPVEMNDPNQWSSRYVHDALFVVDYALIASVMFAAGVSDMILQCQFNKPAETGDFADLAKMTAAREIVEQVRPFKHPARVYIETRAGIEHFSTDLETARFQLARTTLLQMLIDPSMIHLVSYCEAQHAATAEDIIDSSMLVRRAVRLFKENEQDLLKYLDDPIVLNRKDHLLNEAKFVLRKIVGLSSQYPGDDQYTTYSRYLADPGVLWHALREKIMTAPGITHPDYSNPGLLTKPNRFGFIDCYENWEDDQPIKEEQRLSEHGLL